MATMQDLVSAIYQMEGNGPNTLATRNNNPGNLRYVGQAGSTGADANGFAIFPTMAVGQAAAAAQIQLDLTRGTDASGNPVVTLQDLINSWAPSSDNNNPTSYAANVASWTGIDPTAPLASVLGVNSPSPMGLPVVNNSSGDFFTAMSSSISSIDPTYLAIGGVLLLLVWLKFRD